MSKHHHQGKAKQIEMKIHDAVQFQQENLRYQKSESLKPEDVSRIVTVDDSSIQIRAYKLYQEKGGAALDNWLEAEQTLLKG